MAGEAKPPALASILEVSDDALVSQSNGRFLRSGKREFAQIRAWVLGRNSCTRSADEQFFGA